MRPPRRVFSRAGSFEGSSVGIGFVLPRPAIATVTIHTMSVRLVRVVASGQRFSAGTNLPRWVGRAHDGTLVNDGLYLVTAEALRDRRTGTLTMVK